MLREETKQRLVAGCQEFPPEARYKRIMGMWFPGLKGFLAFCALAFGARVMTHEILDCVELQGACENYRRSTRADCGPEVKSVDLGYDPDCECTENIVNCYATEVQEVEDDAGKVQEVQVCITCDQVAADFIAFLQWTGMLVFVLGLLLVIVSCAEAAVVQRNCLSTQALMVLAFSDFGFLGGLVSTVLRKRRYAFQIGEVCKVDNDEARDYAPITMGNLCHYHWLLEYIIIFSIALILVSALNLCWSVFGVVVGVPAEDFDKMLEERDTGATVRTTFGRNTQEIPPLDVPPSTTAAASDDIDLDIR
jgi:hypothetical protein